MALSNFSKKGCNISILLRAKGMMGEPDVISKQQQPHEDKMAGMREVCSAAIYSPKTPILTNRIPRNL